MTVALVPEKERLDVARVVEGARLVVVGGTGFLGKVFWSMLLDRYPGVGRIFLVVRPRGGARKGSTGPPLVSEPASTPEERFWSEIATSETLQPLRTRYGSDFEARLGAHVQPIDGDMSRPLCGLDEALVRELRGTIDAVINVAGVVDFNPPLDEALDANAFGAQNLVALARALGDAPVFHTSTCYVAGSRKGPVREEDPREHPVPPRRRAGGRAVGSRARDRRGARSHRPGPAPLRRRLPPERVRRGIAQEPPRARGAGARRALRARAGQGEAPLHERPPGRRRPRPRDALGLAQHLHVHQGHRRAGHRAQRSRVHHRPPGVLRVHPGLPVSLATTRASTPARRSST